MAPQVDSTVDSDSTLSTTNDTSGETSSSDEIFDDITTTEKRSIERLRRPEAFHRWRPQYHLMAPHGWMNDPCAPGYNAKTEKYHMNLQWNPWGNSWGNLSWGHAESSDLVHWRVSPDPSITPTATLDSCGIFTGCTLPAKDPQSRAESRKLTAFYTSARKLPISYRLPYSRGSERLAVATSSDNGQTWERIPMNIILAEPPPNIDITSWRDPFVDRWEALDNLMCHGTRWLYGTLSGGVRNRTPTIFLYRIDPENTTEWKFLSSLVELSTNFNPSRWSGDFGLNWEVSNFLTLRGEDDTAHEVLITSAEGTIEDSAGGALSKDHRQMWMCGKLRKTEKGQPQLEYRYGGTLDFGSFYAANGFWDYRSKHFVTTGWIFEEDLPQSLVEQQGWSGCLSIPRNIVLKTWCGVVGALKSDLSSLTCFDVKLEEDGTHTLHTVSALPDSRLRMLRSSKILDGQSDIWRYPFYNPCSKWELQIEFDVEEGVHYLGFDIVHSVDGAQYTRVYFEPGSETLFVDRSKSTTVKGINVKTRSAPHTLFTFRQGMTTRRETLNLHVYFDASVLEVFANERTALTTRVYPDVPARLGTCQGVRLFVEAENECASGQQQGVDFKSCMRHCELWALQSAISYPSG
ncbi:hypothetical protein LTR84_010292 [Exophiala bonariae]|uniref:Glycosyl hydrolase family 32 N-terminal domain-containing protein n=1 Tax=Exophiala bonariae TaxID=1690606 RepID=A0AAV9MVF7_9EURO|nr:hypothetical protein LTR84_010292 [Exophiala bonariae]